MNTFVSNIGVSGTLIALDIAKWEKAHVAQEGDRGKNEMCVKIKIAAASATRPERCHRRPKGMNPRSPRGV